VWVDNLPSQARPSASQQGHISNALGPEGFETVVYGSSRSTPPPGDHQHRMDSPAAWSSLAALRPRRTCRYGVELGRDLPGKSWFQLFRPYGPLQPWFDQTWKLNEFEPNGLGESLWE
jgi:hypothetical protein